METYHPCESCLEAISRENILVKGLVPMGLGTVSRKYIAENNPKKTKEELGK